MNLKLFYSPPKWFAFIAPEKPNVRDYYDMQLDLPDNSFYNAMDDYEKAYAEAKANALEVVNWPIIDADDFGLRRLEPGEVYDCPYKSEIKDGKVILIL